VGVAVSRRPIRLSLLDGQILIEVIDDLQQMHRGCAPLAAEEQRAIGALRAAIMKELAPPVDKSGGKTR
jgi:hypothetical protein